MRRTIVFGALAVLLFGVGAPIGISPALADQPTQAPDIDVANVQAHLAELQSIADANGGNRAVGGAGYDGSVDYIAGELEAAGYTVERQKCLECTGQQENVIAETDTGAADQVVMLGGHLDSVSEGPGINDNGSGSAALLELALTVAEQDPAFAKRVRFAWWTAEETGLEGSTYYVSQLEPAEQDRIQGYLNFDMIGSPNAGYFVYDADQTISQYFDEYFASIDVPTEPVDVGGRSDHAAFDAVGIPVGGLFSGAEGTMTSAEAEMWNGTAGQPYDECYHQSCDTTENINQPALNRMSDAAAYALWALAS